MLQRERRPDIRWLSKNCRSGSVRVTYISRASLAPCYTAVHIRKGFSTTGIRLPGIRFCQGCQTETECEDDYLADNPRVGVIDLIFARNLEVKSVLLTEAVKALTQEGKTRLRQRI